MGWSCGFETPSEIRSEKSNFVDERGIPGMPYPSVAEAEGSRLGKAAPSGALRAALPSLQKRWRRPTGYGVQPNEGMAPSGSGVNHAKEA